MKTCKRHEQMLHKEVKRLKARERTTSSVIIRETQIKGELRLLPPD